MSVVTEISKMNAGMNASANFKKKNSQKKERNMPGIAFGKKNAKIEISTKSCTHGSVGPIGF